MKSARANKLTVAQILSLLKELKDEVRRKYKAELKGLFGSSVRGTEKAGSDIDVLVEFEEGANLLDLVGLSLFLEEKLHHPVDVVQESAIREELKEGILNEAVLV